MTNTQISLQLSDGVIVPSQGSVLVKEGDTVVFVNNASGMVLLFFSPDAASALSHAQSSISSGDTVEFAFTTSKPGAYSVFFGLTGSTAPTVFPSDQSTDLSLQVADIGISFGGVINSTTTGY